MPRRWPRSGSRSTIGIGRSVAAPRRARLDRGDEAAGGWRWTAVGEIRRRQSVTLDASGNGSVTFIVRHANQRWIIRYVGVSTSQAPTTAPYPTATVYEGPQQAGMSDGATWTGNQDTFTGRFIMDAGTDLTVAFTGGVVGSVATVVIEGTNELPEVLANQRS